MERAEYVLSKRCIYIACEIIPVSSCSVTMRFKTNIAYQYIVQVFSFLAFCYFILLYFQSSVNFREYHPARCVIYPTHVYQTLFVNGLGQLENVKSLKHVN